MKHKIDARSEFNLIRDKNVLGSEWLRTYNGYFGDRKNIELFIRKILPNIRKKKRLRILYPCSASGILGENLAKRLREKGVSTELVLVDISKDHLRENRNPKTKKILADIAGLDLGQLFDIIIMRSSLDYFPGEKLQIRVLSNLNRHLCKDGVFFNQAASMPSIIERDLADRIYKSNQRMGRRHFQCKADIEKLYKAAGFGKLKEIGNGTPLLLTEKEHAKRYEINETQVERIQKIICEVPAEKRPNIRATKKGYEMKFVFPMYAAWKHKD